MGRGTDIRWAEGPGDRRLRKTSVHTSGCFSSLCKITDYRRAWFILYLILLLFCFLFLVRFLCLDCFSNYSGVFVSLQRSTKLFWFNLLSVNRSVDDWQEVFWLMDNRNSKVLLFWFMLCLTLCAFILSEWQVSDSQRSEVMFLPVISDDWWLLITIMWPCYWLIDWSVQAPSHTKWRQTGSCRDDTRGQVANVTVPVHCGRGQSEGASWSRTFLRSWPHCHNNMKSRAAVTFDPQFKSVSMSIIVFDSCLIKLLCTLSHHLCNDT